MQQRLPFGQRVLWALFLVILAWGAVTMLRHDARTTQHAVHGVERVAKRMPL